MEVQIRLFCLDRSLCSKPKPFILILNWSFLSAKVQLSVLSGFVYCIQVLSPWRSSIIKEKCDTLYHTIGMKGDLQSLYCFLHTAFILFSKLIKKKENRKSAAVSSVYLFVWMPLPECSFFYPLSCLVWLKIQCVLTEPWKLKKRWLEMEKRTKLTSEEVQIISGLLTLKKTLLQDNNLNFDSN